MAVLLAILYVDDGVALPELLDVDDVVVLLELLYLDIPDPMLYDDVADVQFESLDAIEELADVEGLAAGCRCRSLLSRCCRRTLPLTILDVLLDVLLGNVDVGANLLHSHVCLDDMDVVLLRHSPNHDVDDDLDLDPNVVLNISDVDPDLDVANVLADANLEMAGSKVTHQCRFWATIDVKNDVASMAWRWL